VEAPGGRQSLDRNRDVLHPDWTFLDEAGDSFQQRHLKENNYASTNEQPSNDPS
jgi:hypothetical protein